MELAASVRYAVAERLFADSVDAILPSERVDVAEFAAEKRWLANEGGGYVGRWNHAEAPYLVEPMQKLGTGEHKTIAIPGPSQCAKTAVGENWFLASVARDPADMLWYMPTDALLEAFMKTRLNPMIEAHPEELRARLGLRAVDDSLHFKRFRGMSVEFLPTTYSNVISKRAPRIYGDEIDASDKSLGDLKALWDFRRQTFAGSMLLVTSHPDRARGLDPAKWTDGIMAIFADSTRCLWHWACPFCDGYSSPAPLARRVMTLDYPADAPLDVIELEARLKCPLCEERIEDHFRRQMNATGVWVGEGQEIDEAGKITGERIRHPTAGYWILGVMSTLRVGGIGELARSFVKAQRAHETSPTDETERTLREVTVKGLGIPYSPPKAVGTVEAETLVERSESEPLPLGIVPRGARCLMASVDVQAAHFEILVRGFGVDGESWIVDKQRRPADPATSRTDWDGLIEWLFAARYPLEDDPSRGMAIRGIGYDSGGAPGVTHQAYSAWRRWREKKPTPVTYYGKSKEGRDVFRLMPLKGTGNLAAARLLVRWPDSLRKDRKVVRTGTVPLAVFNANLFKDDLGGQLETAEPGPDFLHFPKALQSAEPPHVFFEQVVSEKRKPDGRWIKERDGIRNEALDLLVMSDALASLHGLAGMKWQKPPAWAAEWDANSMIAPLPRNPGAALPPAATTMAAPSSPAAPPSAPAGTVAKVKRSLASMLPH